MRLLWMMALLAAGVQARTAIAQVPAVPASDVSAPSVEQRIAQSSDIGRLLFVYDRAAWVSSDALTAAIAKDRLTGVGGYVVEPADAGTLRVTYFHGRAVEAQAFFIADVRDGKVLHQEMLPQPVALSPRQIVLAHAREIAADRARERGYKPCTSSPFNTVVLPSQGNGPVAVYLMTAQQNGGSYMMGGNYRVIVGADNTVIASRPYNVTCLNMTRPKLPAGAKPVGFVVNHLLDPVPTEIHVFASYSLQMPLFVSTPDHRAWRVQGNSITLSSSK